MHDRFRSRFDDDADPMAVMGNLVDVMLVFACGLIAALLSRSPAVSPAKLVREIEAGQELQDRPEDAVASGRGLESVGSVFRDPQTGKLILVDERAGGTRPDASAPQRDERPGR